MIITENVTMYKCSHCPKRYFRKQDIVRHEFNCSYNPKNFSACSGCSHLEEIKIPYLVPESADEYGGTEEKEATGFFCKKLQQKMYPFKAVKKGLVKKYPETFKDQIQMPTTCDLFKQETCDFEDFDYEPEPIQKRDPFAISANARLIDRLDRDDSLTDSERMEIFQAESRDEEEYY